VASPVAGLIAFPNRIYPIVKIFFDICQKFWLWRAGSVTRNRLELSVGQKPNPKSAADEVQLRLRAGFPNEATPPKCSHAAAATGMMR
jgi:hypothetical protein